MALETAQDFAGQPVKLHQCLIWPLDLHEEVLEYCIITSTRPNQYDSAGALARCSRTTSKDMDLHHQVHFHCCNHQHCRVRQ